MFIHQITFKCFHSLVSGASVNATRSSNIEPTKKTLSKKIFKSKPKAPVRQTTTTTKTTTTATTTTYTPAVAVSAAVKVVTTRPPLRQTQKPRRIVPTSKPKTKIVSTNDLEVNQPDKGVADGKVLFTCDFRTNEKSCNMK